MRPGRRIRARRTMSVISLASRKAAIRFGMAGVILCGLTVWLIAAWTSGKRPLRPDSYAELLKLSEVELARVDIARMNLLCWEGSSSNRYANVDAAEKQLDSWAERVRSETERHRYRFDRDPGEFENSEGFFKMLMLAVVLAEDFRVHYREDLRAGPEDASPDDGFLSDSKAVFLTGLLGRERAGTCSSMPVLQVGVGRRLGYPLKLVTTKGHLFVRWDGEGERFNVEMTGQVNPQPDDYYRHWPFEVSNAEEAAEGYLQSLTPAGELAVFLAVQAACLREEGRFRMAAEAFAEAAQRAPHVASFKLMAAQCRQDARTRQGSTQTTSEES